MKAFCVDLRCSGKSMKSQPRSAVTVQRARRRLTLFSSWFQPMENFTTAIAKGNRKAVEIQGMIRWHSRLINLLGVKQICIGVNKMDCDTAGYKQERYDEISNEVRSMLIKVGWIKDFVAKNTTVLPISLWMGDNLDFIAKNMPVLLISSLRRVTMSDFIAKNTPALPISGSMSDNLLKKSE